MSTPVDCMTRKSVFVAVAAALAFAATAAAAYQPHPWTLRDMKTAIHAIGYPKPHPRKLACTGIGQKTSFGQYPAFKCSAVYRGRRRRFQIGGSGQGGWLCGGARIASCRILGRGFVTTAELAADGSMGYAADLASAGYLGNHNTGPYQRQGYCQQNGSAWACPYIVNNKPVTVTLTFKQARGGYVITGSTS